MFRLIGYVRTPPYCFASAPQGQEAHGIFFRQKAPPRSDNAIPFAMKPPKQ